MLFSGGIPLLLAFIFVFLALGIACAPVCGRSCIVISDEPLAGKRRIRKWAGRLCYILALLALGGAVGLTNFGRQAGSEERLQSMAFHLAVQAALTRYYEEYGEYPAPKQAQVSVEIDGHFYNAAGALALYQALSGDGDDHLLLATGHHSASDGKVTDAETSNACIKDMPMKHVRRINAGYILTDGFGHPIQYTVGGEDGVNADYDLWSFAGSTPLLKVDKAARQSPAVSGQWIKNW